MRQKLIPCFLATALVFTGAIGASLLTADPAFAVVDALTAGPTEGAGGSKLHFDGRVAIRGEKVHQVFASVLDCWHFGSSVRFSGA